MRLVILPYFHDMLSPSSFVFVCVFLIAAGAAAGGGGDEATVTKPPGIVIAADGTLYESIRAAMADPATCGQKLELRGVFVDPFDVHADKDYACDSLWLECSGEDGKPCATIIGGDWAFTCTASVTMRNIIFDGAFVHDLAFVTLEAIEKIDLTGLKFRNYLRNYLDGTKGPTNAEEKLTHLEAKVKQLVVSDILESQRRATATESEQVEQAVFNEALAAFERAHPRGWASYKHYVDVVKQPHRAPVRLTELDQDPMATVKQVTTGEKSPESKEKNFATAANKSPAYAHVPRGRVFMEYPYAADVRAAMEANRKRGQMKAFGAEQSEHTETPVEQKELLIGEKGRPIYDLTENKPEKELLVGEKGLPIFDLTDKMLIPEFEASMPPPPIRIVSTVKEMFNFLTDDSAIYGCHSRAMGDIMKIKYLHELPPRMAKKYSWMMECGPNAVEEFINRHEKQIAAVTAAMAKGDATK